MKHNLPNIIVLVLRKYYSLEIAAELLLDNVDLFCPNKKLLVIGMAPTGLFQGTLQKLKQREIIPDVVELNEENAEWVRMAHKLKVFNMDAKNFNSYDDYDCVYWAEGPEHVSTETFNIINGKVKKSFIIECPWGEAPEDVGRVGMKHVNAWKPEQFEELNFNVMMSAETYKPNGLPLICGYKLKVKNV